MHMYRLIRFSCLFSSRKTLCSHLCVETSQAKHSFDSLHVPELRLHHLHRLCDAFARQVCQSNGLAFTIHETTTPAYWLISFPSRVQEVVSGGTVTWSSRTEEFLLLCGLAGLVASFNPQLGQDLRGIERPLTAAAPPKTCFSCPAEAPRVG